jgi:hypothetical protein
MRSTAGGLAAALCLKVLHRHPRECAHLPGSVLVDLLAYTRIVAGEVTDGD